MKPLINRPPPKKHEGLESFLYRLSLANHYTIRTLACFVAEEHWQSISLNSLKSQKAFEKISKLTLVSEERLQELTLHRFSPLMTGSQFFSSGWKKIFILRKTRFCPDCIGESKYHRLHWKVKPITVCMEHGVILLDRCPKCNKTVGTVEILSGHCKCGVDLSTLKATKLKSDKPIKYQKYIQWLLGLEDNATGVNVRRDGPVFDLGPSDFFTLLNLMSKHCSKLRADSPLMQTGEGNPKLPSEFVIYNSACEILLNWEDKFFVFLEEYRKANKKTRLHTGVEKDFLGLFRGIGLNNKQFEFMREAFYDYLGRHWDGGIIKSHMKFFYKDPSRSRRFISVKEVKDILNVSTKTVLKLLEMKKLSCITRQAGEFSQYLIESDDVYKLKKEMDKFLYSREVSKRLNLGKRNVSRLKKEGLLSLANHEFPLSWDDGHLYRSKDVIEFEKKFLYNKNFRTVDSISQRLVSIREAAYKLSTYKMNIPRLLSLIEGGVIKPTIYEKEKGISRLYFDKSEIEGLFSLLREDEVKKKGTCLEKIARSMNMAEYVLKRYMDRGLLNGQIENYGRQERRYISEKDLENFRKEYVFIEEAVEILKLTKATIYKWIRLGRIKAYSGPDVDGVHRYLLKREEIKKFMPRCCFSGAGVASRLNVSRKKIHDLIKGGKVNILGGPGYDEGGYYVIHKSEIPKIRKLINV